MAADKAKATSSLKRDRSGTCPHQGPPLHTGNRRPFSLRRFASCLVSKLDTRKDSDGSRLYGRSTTEDRRSGIRLKDDCVVRISSPLPFERLRVRSMKSGGKRPRFDVVLRKQRTLELDFARDVRASSGPRSPRHPKGEPPLQKRGLPLAAPSLIRDRVPLRPRKAVEHPDTSGTVRDVGAPRGHDGPPRFEEVRALIGS